MKVRTIVTIAFLAIVANVAPALGESASGPLVRSDDERSLTDAQLLGKRIFEDATLSEPAGQSCASCHDPQRAFQGGSASPVPGISSGAAPGRMGVRKSPSIMYRAYSPPFGFYKDADEGKAELKAKGGQFWDGRANDLVEQVAGPLLNPVEMNNPSVEAVVAKFKASKYAPLATALYGADVFDNPAAAMKKMSEAVFAFETSPRFMPFSSKFDDYLRGAAQLSEQEMRGLAIFSDKKKSNCIDCHAGKVESKDPADWIFSDFSYDALGAPRNAAIPVNADASHYDLGLCQQPGLQARLPKGVKLASLCGAFKAPSLRNVAVSAPYFHNGSIATLREAVAFYATRDTDPGHWYPRTAKGKIDKFNDLPGANKASVSKEIPYDRKLGQKPRLSERDIDDIVAFLQTLTDKGMH